MLNLLQANASYGCQYHYNRLGAGQKRIYAKIYRVINALSPSVNLPLVPMNELSMIFSAVLYDNPLFFYVSAFHLSTDLYKRQIAFSPDYKYDKKYINESIAAIQQYLQIFDSIKTCGDLEKEIFIHDYCLNNFCYDGSFSAPSYSVLGPVFHKQGVCEGIASFVKLACDYVGLENLLVVGRGVDLISGSTADKAHAWNIVTIGGEPYHLDVTFNLTLKETLNRYDYFNLSDTDIHKDHIIGIGTPPCTTTGNDYFTRNSLLAYNSKELEKIIFNMLLHGQRNFLVKLMNVQSKDEITNRVLSTAQKQYGMIYKAVATVNVRPNLNQMVFEVRFA